MSPEVISIIILALMFIIGTLRGVNMGVLGFVAAFAVGLSAVGMTVDEIAAGFPVDLFLALMGLTFLFGFAQNNGSIDFLVRWGLRAVRGRVAAAPWIFFLLSAILMSIGAIFAIAIVAPLAIPFARKYKINQLMMGMMVVHGGMAGAFSPVSVYGVFVNGFLAKEDIPSNALYMFLASLVFNTLLGTIVYFTMGGRRLIGVRIAEDGADAPQQGGPTPRPLPVAASAPHGLGSSSSGNSVVSTAAPVTASVAAPALMASSARPRATPFQMLTLLGLAVMAVGTAAFNFDIGVLSLTIACVLAIVAPKDAKAALAQVSWSTVVLVGGVLTYIAVLQQAGTVEFVSAGIAALGVPLLAVLLLCYLSGIVSALASSLGTIGIAIAIAAPFLSSGELNPIGFVAAIAISATVVDVSPFSTNGALVLANIADEDRDRFYRRMLVYSGCIVAFAPAAAWLIVFVPFPL